MRAFAYQRAESIADAVELIAHHPDAQLLAGGTNLVDLMRQGVYRPAIIVDISGLPLADIDKRDDGSVLIGSTATNSDLAVDPYIRANYPMLSQAILAGASGQVRNMASVGGNLLQRTRCTYFADVSKPCNKRKPDSGCPARTGIHRDLAVIGHSEACIAAHPSDMAVAMTALDALVHVTGPEGRRTIPIGEFHRLPGDDPTRDTVLSSDELITAVELPPPAEVSRNSTYRKARDRASFAFAVGSVAVGVHAGDDAITELRLAFGAVAPKPWRAYRAEIALCGGPVAAETIEDAVRLDFAEADPLPQNGFKIDLAVRLATATILELARASR